MYPAGKFTEGLAIGIGSWDGAVRTLSRLLRICILFITAFAVSSASAVISANTNIQEKTYPIEIASMPLSQALLEFSKQTDIAIVAPATLVRDKRSGHLEGRYAPSDAIQILLEGNEIGFEFKDQNTIILRRLSAKPAVSKTRYESISFNSNAYYEKNLGYYDASVQGSRTASSNIDEIFITGDNREYDKTKMSMSTQLLLTTPGTLNDPLWGFLTSPGVTFGSSAYSGEIIIRGSSPDDHLFLIDGMYAGYLFHDFGDGILSKNTIHRFQLKPSAFGAEYGNAIGSVIDVGLRNPDTRKFHGNIDINMIKAGAHLETPVGDNGGFYVDARYNTLHLFKKSFDDEKDLSPQIDLVPKNFDYTTRYRYEKNDLAYTVTAIGAQDIDTFEAKPLAASAAAYDEETRSNFHTQAIAIEKRWDSGATLDTVMSHTKLTKRRKYADNRFESFSQGGYYVRSKFEIELNNHAVMAGANYSREKGIFDYDTRLIFCDDFSGTCPFSDFEQRKRGDTFNDLQLYIQDHISFSDAFSLELGFQFSRDFFLNESFFEPRIGAFWQASKTVKLYARAGRHHQRQDVRRYLALRYTARAQLNDRSTHFLIGTQVQLARGLYMASEAYYRHQDAALYPESSQERLVSGSVYGFEVSVSKPVKRVGLSGSISIGYANSKRRDEGTGQQINYRYSRPFNGLLGLQYSFRSGWSVGGRYHMQSGLLYTPLGGIRVHKDGHFQYDYGALYSKRTNDYNRLDFRVEKRSKYSFGELVYHLDVINVLNQKSPEDPTYGSPISDGQGGYTVPLHTNDGFPMIISLGIGLTF